MNTQRKVKFLRTIIPILIVFVYSNSLFSQNLIFQHLSIDNGFPANVVYDIEQDSYGDIWFGTDIGLFRYDNQVYSNYTHPSIKESEIIEVCLADSVLFFASLSGHVFYIKQDSVYKLTTDSLFTGISQITYNQSADLVYFTSLKGLTIYNYKQNRIIDTQFNIVDCHGRFIKSDSLPTVYCLNGNTLFRYEVDDNKFTQQSVQEKKYSIQSYKNYIIGNMNANKSIVYKYLNNKATDFSALDNQLARISHVYTMKTDSKHNLWISCNLGLIRVNLSQPTMIQEISRSVDGHRVNCIFEDMEGNFWFGTNGAGIYFWNGNNILHYNSYNSKLPNNYIYKINTDAPNTFFVGTKEGWISKINTSGISNYQLPNAKEAIYDIEYLENDKIAVANSCLYQIGIKSGRIKTIDNFISCQVKEIYKNSNNKISVAAGNTIQLDYDSTFVTITSLNNRAYTLTHYKDDFLIGTTGGILKINLSNKLILEPTNTSNQGSEYHVYFSKNDRLEYFNFQSPHIKNLAIKNGEVNSSITALVSIDSLSFWAGTKTKGLYLIQEDSIVYHYNKSNGLNSNIVNEMVLDEENKLWIATPNGINYISEKGDKISSITTNNGLLTNYINTIAVKDSNVYIGTPIGLSILKENELKTETQPPTAVLRQVTINETPTQLQNVYNLSSKENTLHFKLKNVSFKHDYNYKFKLGNEKWKTIQNREFLLQNLSPGTYQLLLKIETPNGISGKVNQLKIKINPPWWQTKSFFIFFVLTGLMIIRSIYKRQTQILVRRENRKVETTRKLAELKLQALQSQMNPHFIFNSLNAIQSFILVGNVTVASEYLGEFSRLMRMFLESSRNRYITLNEEIQLLDLYVKLEKLRFEDKFQFNFNYDQVDLEQEIPSMLIQPFVENAINHGLLFKKGKGKLAINFSRKENDLICSIIDNGIGRKKAMELKAKASHSYKSRGMKIIEEKIDVLQIVDKVYASIKIIDLLDDHNHGIGTEVVIKIPLEE